MNKILKVLICIGFPVIIWSFPTQWLPLEGLTLMEHRLIVVFFLAALCWILEPFPIFATSVLIIVLELVLVSDKALILLRTHSSEQLGILLSHKEIMATFALPYVILMLLFAWLLLFRFFPPMTAQISINIRGQFRKSSKAFTVFITFGITILLWLLDFLHVMNAYIVAMIPVAVFLVTQIITAQDMKRMSWDVLKWIQFL